MKFCMKFGDTNFIGIANPERYKSFFDEDWELIPLMHHFGDEMKDGNILVFQMTKEGIEHSWNIELKIGEEVVEHKCYRRTSGYIKVTCNQLYLVDYDCLTMAAQFKTNKVPDRNCSNYKIDIENGIYKVDIFQFYNVDKGEFIGSSETEILMYFSRVDIFQQTANEVQWCIFL